MRLGGKNQSHILQNSNQVTVEVYMAAFRNKRRHTALEKTAVVFKLKKMMLYLQILNLRTETEKHVISICLENIA